MTTPILEARDLSKLFPGPKKLFTPARFVTAVDRVSLAVMPGETLAIVGESGSGKSTLGRLLLRLLAASEGRVFYQGEEITDASGVRLNQLRRELQIIFQDPFASLNPRLSVGEIIGEGFSALSGAGPGWAANGDPATAIGALLQQVGLAADAAGRYPHEFSGGQRQRIAIARVLAVQPELIVCDEPTSALDVSVQAQILNLLKSLQDELGLAYLFVTHNLAVVEYLAHEVAVMYLGRIVEQGQVDELLQAPRHPYTRALLSAVPSVRLDDQPQFIRLAGEMPSPAHPPAGCHFHPRCAQASAACRADYPETTWVSATHQVRCHLYR